ncbi:mediator of RNA polymerase ii transcription subunit 10 [Anaeramoeba flamelloides]|uniref:Mediator of RNA polymerase II transcription subunit 10 n=1 Tax=Anaeramoeba flamelloides TaxID=1746091 RepID=A0ABQ8XYG4_9EUKA|nr:mediator of RNA polymerase ii transcription subunit 10 [Anaeramoeba flamelloides]
MNSPIDSTNEVEKELEHVCELLRLLIIHVEDFSQDNQETLFLQINNLIGSYQRLVQLESKANQVLPIEILEKIDSFLNPDLYTKECLSMCLEKNEEIKLKTSAFQEFQKNFESELENSFSDLLKEYKETIEKK